MPSLQCPYQDSRIIHIPGSRKDEEGNEGTPQRIYKLRCRNAILSILVFWI
jgi:hypothetical protein